MRARSCTSFGEWNSRQRRRHPSEWRREEDDGGRTARRAKTKEEEAEEGGETFSLANEQRSNGDGHGSLKAKTGSFVPRPCSLAPSSEAAAADQVE